MHSHLQLSNASTFEEASRVHFVFEVVVFFVICLGGFGLMCVVAVAVIAKLPLFAKPTLVILTRSQQLDRAIRCDSKSSRNVR